MTGGPQQRRDLRFDGGRQRGIAHPTGPGACQLECDGHRGRIENHEIVEVVRPDHIRGGVDNHGGQVLPGCLGKRGGDEHDGLTVTTFGLYLDVERVGSDDLLKSHESIGIREIGDKSSWRRGRIRASRPTVGRQTPTRPYETATVVQRLLTNRSNILRL
jgi:hypothetical protein